MSRISHAKQNLFSPKLQHYCKIYIEIDRDMGVRLWRVYANSSKQKQNLTPEKTIEAIKFINESAREVRLWRVFDGKL